VIESDEWFDGAAACCMYACLTAGGKKNVLSQSGLAQMTLKDFCLRDRDGQARSCVAMQKRRIGQIELWSILQAGHPARMDTI
jgi:hypothetical protein